MPVFFNQLGWISWPSPPRMITAQPLFPSLRPCSNSLIIDVILRVGLFHCNNRSREPLGTGTSTFRSELRLRNKRGNARDHCGRCGRTGSGGRSANCIGSDLCLAHVVCERRAESGRMMDAVADEVAEE